MTKEETWSVPMQRARTFFREQEDVTEESSNVYRFGSCRITLTELKPKGMGVWAAKRIKVHMDHLLYIIQQIAAKRKMENY